jgi:hypothetical protein
VLKLRAKHTSISVNLSQPEVPRSARPSPPPRCPEFAQFILFCHLQFCKQQLLHQVPRWGPKFADPCKKLAKQEPTNLAGQRHMPSQSTHRELAKLLARPAAGSYGCILFVTGAAEHVVLLVVTVAAGSYSCIGCQVKVETTCSGGSWEQWWLMGAVVAHGSSGGSWEQWWLMRAVVAHGSSGGSLVATPDCKPVVPGSNPAISPAYSGLPILGWAAIWDVTPL